MTPTTQEEIERRLTTRFPTVEPWMREAASCLTNGDTISATKKRIGVSSVRLNTIIHAIGWDLNWRRCSRPNMTKDRLQMRAEVMRVMGANRLSFEVASILYRDHGFTLEKLGELAGGITKEAARQLLAQGGLIPGEIIKRRRQERHIARELERVARLKKNREARRVRIAAKYAAEIEAYNLGVPMHEIAANTNRSRVGFHALVSSLRNRHGLFMPLRKVRKKVEKVLDAPV